MSHLDQLNVNPQLDSTLAQQLKQQLTWLIASGQLKAGDRLPSLRQLALHLHININTVRGVYQALEGEGLVGTRPGAATRVLPSPAGRWLKRRKGAPSHTIGVIIPSMNNPFYHALLQGIEDVAHPERSLIFVCNTHDKDEEAGRYFAQLSSKGVDGIILASHAAPPHTSGETGLPFVSVDWPPSQGHSVLVDLESAGYQATLHLAQHGHRRIGLITFAGDADNVRPVNAGYSRALHAAGLPADPALVAGVNGFDMDAGETGARQLLALSQPPEAIFAITDLLALGALRAIRSAGLRVPQDFALAGFNDIPQSGLVDPPLTTVAAPVRQMGQEAMSMLQALIATEQPARRQVVLPVTLVVRQSCGCHEVT